MGVRHTPVALAARPVVSSGGPDRKLVENDQPLDPGRAPTPKHSDICFHDRLYHDRKRGVDRFHLSREGESDSDLVGPLIGRSMLVRPHLRRIFYSTVTVQ